MHYYDNNGNLVQIPPPSAKSSDTSSQIEKYSSKTEKKLKWVWIGLVTIVLITLIIFAWRYMKNHKGATSRFNYY